MRVIDKTCLKKYKFVLYLKGNIWSRTSTLAKRTYYDPKYYIRGEILELLRDPWTKTEFYRATDVKLTSLDNDGFYKVEIDPHMPGYYFQGTVQLHLCN